MIPRRREKVKKMETSKMQPGWIYDDVYGMNFYFHIGWSIEDMDHYSRHTYGHETDWQDSDGRCLRVVFQENGAIGNVIWIRKSDDYATLAHECVHAARNTFDDRNIDIRDSDTETFAYYVEFLMNAALNKINKNRQSPGLYE